MQIEPINKKLITFRSGSPTSPLKFQDLEFKMYFRAQKGNGGRAFSHVPCRLVRALDLWRGPFT